MQLQITKVLNSQEIINYLFFFFFGVGKLQAEFHIGVNVFYLFYWFFSPSS